MVKVTYYLEVISSWCHWAEPAWSELKKRYAGQCEFDWKIALMPLEGYPVSRSQCEWFYRRSGSIVRSPYMLNAEWLDAGKKDYTAPNYTVEAARVLGVTDDRVRLAVAEAAVRQGKRVAQWDIAVQIAAAASGLEQQLLLQGAKSPEVAARVNASTAEFTSLQVTQRPTFLIQNSIGDRAVFSGIVQAEPLIAAIEALRSDEAAYVSWKAHFGDPPRQ